MARSGGLSRVLPGTPRPRKPTTRPTPTRGDSSFHEKCVQPLRDGPDAVRQGRRRPRPRRPVARPAALPAPRVPLLDPRPDGRRDRQGVPRLPRPAQRCARPLQGRHPLPPAGDRRHGPGPGDVDDVEVRRRRHPARRREGRCHLRPAQPQRPGAGGDLPRLDPPGRQERRPGERRPGARRHDDPAAHALDARRVRDHHGREGPRLHHGQAGRHGRLARPHRGDGLRPRLHAPRGPQAARHPGRADEGLRPGLRERLPVRHPPLPAARRQGHRPSPRGTRPTRPPTASGSSTASTPTRSSPSPTASAGSTRRRRRASATRCSRATRGSSRTWRS